MKVARICLNCGKIFFTYNSIKNKYCSKFCWGQSQIHKIKRVCLTCGNEFETIQSEINRGGGKYCSHACHGKSMSGDNNINRLRSVSKETRFKQSLAKKGKRPACSGRGTGYKHTIETRKRMSKLHKLDKNPAWRGGISFEPYCPKFNDEFKERVRKHFNYMCVWCGEKQKDKKLHIHHVNFNKNTCCDNSKPIFVTLCSHCHPKTNHNRIWWEFVLTMLVNEKYNGICYIKKECER